MKRDFLRDLGIDEEHIPKILDEHHDSVREYKNAASEVDGLKTQLQTANDEIEKRDNQIQSLKDNSPDNDELQTTLNNYKTDNENYKKKLEKVQLDSAIKLAVAKHSHDPEDILMLVDKEGLELSEDGKTVKGLDDKLTALKENKAYLFVQEAPVDEGEPPKEEPSYDFIPGSEKFGNGGKKVTDEEFAKAKYEELFGKKEEE